jgi:hypothetical protein
MEGLHESETYDGLDKKVNRKWRKNTEVKISRAENRVAERVINEQNEHPELWQQLIGAELGSKNETAKDLKKHELANNEVHSIENRHGNPTEAHAIHGGLQPERIGHVLINAAETKHEVPSKQVQIPRAEINKRPPQSIIEYIATINREELLDISSKISVDGTTLRQAYETHLIGENALRRLISEHVQGGDVRAALKAEITQHEIDFERDPQMRDHVSQKITDVKTGDGDDQAVQQTHEGQTEKKLLNAVNTKPTEQQEQYPEPSFPVLGSHSLDMVLAGVIAILLALVVFLLIKRN